MPYTTGSELFGYYEAAFTEVGEQRTGYLEEAQLQSLFLDQIAEVPACVQVMPLLFLEEDCLEQLGSTKLIEVEVGLTQLPDGFRIFKQSALCEADSSSGDESPKG